MNADEYRAKGFVFLDGEWFAPGHPKARASARAGNPGQIAELERRVRDGTMGAVQVQKRISGRFFVRVTSFRHRLLDEDNLCEKYVCDLCRYAGALPSDAPSKAKIEVAQEKVGSKEREFVRVEVFKIQDSVLTQSK